MTRRTLAVLAAPLLVAGLSACGLGGDIATEIDPQNISTINVTFNGTVGGLDASDTFNVTNDAIQVSCTGSASIRLNPSGSNVLLNCNGVTTQNVFPGDVVVVTATTPNTSYSITTHPS